MTKTKDQAAAFSPRTMLTLVLVGIVCTLGLILISAFEPELKSGNDGRTHALSKASVGYAGMVRLLAETGEQTSTRRKKVGNPDERVTLVLTPTASTDGEQLLDFKNYGPIVVLLPKWQTLPDTKRRGWSYLSDRTSPITLERMLAKAWSKDRGGVKITETSQPVSVPLRYQSWVRNVASDFGVSQPIKNLRTISGKDWAPMVALPNGDAIIAKHRTQNIYVVADPDLFNNAGLSNLANARLLKHFITDIREQKPVIFDLTLNGFQRQPNLGRVAIEPPVLGATLCLLLASILAAFQAATRFLPAAAAQRFVSLGKRALADNTAGLVRMGRREHRMATPYAELMKKRVAKLLGVPLSLDNSGLVTALDRVSELSKSNLRFSQLSAQAETATSKGDVLEVAEKLHRWKQETTGERQ